MRCANINVARACSASERPDFIKRVEQSILPARRTLGQLGKRQATAH